MSFASLLNASLVIERTEPSMSAGTPPEAVVDAYGQAVMTWATLATVPGRIRPVGARGREAGLVDQGGAAIGTHIIDVMPTDVTTGDRVREAADTTGPYYQLVGVRDSAGHGHHLELDAVRVD